MRVTSKTPKTPSLPGPIRAEEVRLWESTTDTAANRLVLAFITAASVLYVLLRLRHLAQYSLWYDEVFSVTVARSSWREAFRQILIDRVHPPFFYFALKLWINVAGQSMVAIRLFSVLCSVLTLVPVWNCFRQASLSAPIRVVLLFAIACNPFLIFYSQEVRMYALLGLLSGCSLSLYLAAEDKSSAKTFLLCAVNILLVMTHVAGLAVVGCELIHLVIMRKRFERSAAIACVPALLAFVCWTIAVRAFAPRPTAVLHNVSWIPRPTITVAWKTLAHILGGSVSAMALNIPIALAYWKRARDRRFFLLFVLLSLWTIAFVFAFSAAIRPIWQERYLIIAVIPYSLLAGWSAERLPRNWKLGCAAAILMGGLVSLEYVLTHRPDRPVFAPITSIARESQEQLLSSYDIAASALSFEAGTSSSHIRILKSVNGPNHAGVNVTTREIAYSVGQRDWITDQQVIAVRDFLYIYDTSIDSLLPTGVRPADLKSAGCELTKLAITHGQGHEFTLYKATCAPRQSSHAVL
ncbi:MAG TPA: glycosyltransferase family 39 protein [Terriglobales bacterium]|nr:glycosyltransferase family 39 protein [Terriglobales bacterium]